MNRGEPDRTAAPPAAAADACLRLLNAARRRARAQTVAAAVLALATAALAFFLAEFLLDYNLDIPVPARAVFLAVLLAVFARACVVFAVRPLRRVTDEDELARLIEETHPGLRGELLTAVQLGRPGNPAAAYVSAALIEQVRRRARERAATIDVRATLPAGRLRLPAGAFLGAGLLWVLVIVVHGDVLDTWRTRLLLADRPWPRSVRLEISRPEGENVLVARGDDLLIEVSVLKGSVRQVELVCDWGETTRVEAMTGWGDRVYRHTLPNLTRPVSFYARGGDGRTSVRRVTLVARPRIESIACEVDYPEYTGLGRQASEDGNIKGLVGSTVRFSAVAKPPITSATFRFLPSGAETPSQEISLPVVQDPALAASRLEGSFAITASGYYSFTLESAEGFVNEAPSRYRVRATTDRVPQVTINAPAPTEECTREAEVAIEAELSDDWGLASARLTYRITAAEGAGREARPAEPEPVEERRLAITPGEKELSVRHAFNLAELSLEDGSSVLWRIEATDAAGGTGRSTERMLIVVRPEDLRDIVFDRLGTIREELRSLAEYQDRSRQRLAGLSRDSTDKAALGGDAASPLAQARADEQNLGRRLDGAVEDLRRLRERMVRNMVGDLKEQKWVGSLGDEVDVVAGEKVRPLSEDIGKLADQASGGSASPAQLEPLISRQREVAEDLRNIADRMDQFGDVNQLIRQLEEILGAEERVKGFTRELMDRD